MQRVVTYLALFLFFITTCLSAQSKKIPANDLYTLGKVWGLLKYYHPAVSQGKLNWDSILLATLASGQNKDQAVTHWFEILGKTTADQLAPVQSKCDSITLRNFDIRWLEQSKEIAAGAKARLLELVRHPKNIGSYYSNPNPGTINFSSKNEKVYDHFSPDIKMLELFRAWNVIEYFYPYKYLGDKKWDDVLKKYITLFRNISTEQDYKTAIMLFAAEIQDTHVSFEHSYQYDVLGKFTAPFIFQVVDNGVLITGVKDEEKVKKAGIDVGDFITKINGKPVKEIIAARSKYIAVSNPAVMRREAYQYLFSSNDSICTIEGVKENGKTIKTKLGKIKRVFLKEWDADGIPAYQLLYKGKAYDYLVWNPKESRPHPGFRLNDKAYIDFASLRAKDIDSLMQAYRDTKGIVFDLRGYNNDGALLKIFDYLFSKPEFFGIKTCADFNQPGKFCFKDHIILESYKYTGKENPDAYKGQVIVLMNEYTQSAAEMWAMVFKKRAGALFIGSQTAGADGNKTTIKLTDGNEIYFSGLGIYYPDGSETQRIGIKPDIIVRPTIQSMRKREDLLLQKAFDMIDNKK
ncbi:S41 family peptidase [Sediminibacterium ginsengisoli]|uniref:Peptidase family S41 n=1 Tax=Sediminibacterium ginsengisoli TaxID=413434 RepID=A0A1T4K600_9BACT|nr:S41 family peptidase [Sediminibacterium ginsengisoli]SJZ37832.1 Peptidase family S41 [Sediminibacterium ginsengisoli]